MKNCLLLLAAMLATAGADAQPGLDEMNQARRDFASSFFSAFDCALVLAAILGIAGAVKIYHNWQMGDERITAAVSAWFFAALFILLAGAFLRALFGI